MNGRVFGVAVVGTGIMGRRMLAALQPHPRFRVAGLWDPDANALEHASLAAPAARVAGDLATLVSDPEVDLVYVASPPALHRAGVQAAFAAGRACLCEKPLAANVDEAGALCDLVVASGLPFAVNFPFASAPAARGLVELVRSGVLGEIRRASITVRFADWPRPWQTAASRWLAGPVEGGFTREVLSHFVFLAQRLFGPATVADVRLTRAPGRAETALRVQLVHAGVRVSIDGAVAGGVADTNRFEVVGSRETVALVDWGRLERGGTMTDRVDATPYTLDRVAAMLEGREDHDLATVDEGLAVVRCIESMLAVN
jgi:predicted dehydrogenase